MQSLCILGATGSIGKSTLDVVRKNPDLYRVESLTANSNINELLLQIIEFKPTRVVVVNEKAADQLSVKLKAHTEIDAVDVLHGEQALCQVAQDMNVDMVMAAIVGAAGLLPTLAAVRAGKKVLLANKESLVMSGELFMNEVIRHNAILLPIDSEHNAIFQCMPFDVQKSAYQHHFADQGVSKILLTGSGGPFLNTPISDLSCVTPEQAVAHPNWSMGRKISVDSATMMNKGLEFIEAKWLFNASAEDIEVVIHPQSVIHSMVQYVDGSVIAQMGNPDMRTPIAHAMAFPQRIDSGVKPLNFFECKDFTFTEPDFARYPCLALAIEACNQGQGATTVLNAANEIAVEAFLNNQLGFTDIATVVKHSMTAIGSPRAESIDDVLAIDNAARVVANEWLNSNKRQGYMNV
ncbi:1-deoxy-D-xylulose-5-phosphate reductoisomerase [Flocculibacter collagenilyticus]|uniref:1-deoxy-D-xylulose-5-phosphate reductoisomerase n=1 Tax=Flocculibacter collagenilyticus TaxID=2744479 RepID=UPI0018F60223|nr:1-deoxy-D-xylulose-5-phosphate reductoisomerase [Flocculibacter collagenilyticus]